MSVSGQEHALNEPTSFVTRRMVAEALSDKPEPSPLPLTVCFTGHRHLSEELLPLLTMELDSLLHELYARGCRDFYNGGALGFDILAAERVLLLRDRYPDVQLIMALPCADQAARWSDADVRRYEHILIHANKTHVLSPSYYSGCMQMRNRYMVDHSDICLCYMLLSKGGTASTVAYASQKNLPVINLALALPRPGLREMQLLEEAENQLLP